MLILLDALGGLVNALTGRGGLSRGDPGGELAIALKVCLVAPEFLKSGIQRINQDNSLGKLINICNIYLHPT